MSNKKLLDKSIENIYSLTPLQEGMLFHALNNPKSTNYVLQSTFSLRFALDESALRNAMRALSQRYEVLRTAIL